MIGPPVIGAARDIGHQVHGPSQSQSDDNVGQPDRTCVFNTEIIVSLLQGRNKHLQTVQERLSNVSGLWRDRYVLRRLDLKHTSSLSTLPVLE